ncbi:MAG: hypothetical protein ABWY58_11580 [Aeromicrobium sp.]
MTTRPTPMRAMPALLPLVLAAVLLSGCGRSDGGSDTGSSAARPPASPAESGGTAEPATSSGAASGDFPTCDEAKAALGPKAAGLVELPGSDNGVTTGAGGPSLVCAWHTKETSSDNIHMEQYGGISVGISRDPEFTEESMEPLGWVVKDPTVSAAGAWALKVGGTYDPSDQLDVTGVQVVRDGVVITFTSGGVALQDVPQLASLTNQWAMGAGVALLDLMDRR